MSYSPLSSLPHLSMSPPSSLSPELESLIAASVTRNVRELLPGIVSEVAKVISDQLGKSLTDCIQNSFKEGFALLNSNRSDLSVSTSQSVFSPSSFPPLSSQPLSIAQVSVAMQRALSGQEELLEKSRRAVLENIEEAGENTERNDRSLIASLLSRSNHSSLSDLVDIHGNLSSTVSFRRFPETRVPRPGYPRIIKVSFCSQKLRDLFLQSAAKDSERRRLHPHSFVRRDFTKEELAVDRAARREAGKRNSELGQLAWVVRDSQPFKLAIPRPLPERSRIGRDKAMENMVTSQRIVPGKGAVTVPIADLISQKHSRNIKKKKQSAPSSSTRGRGRGRGGTKRKAAGRTESSPKPKARAEEEEEYETPADETMDDSGGGGR